jgi:hypothetical protein
MRPRLFPLASFELAWTDAAFDAIYPAPLPSGRPGTVLPHGVASMHPARFFDDVLGRIPLEQSFGLRVTLWMIALAPLFTIRKLGTIGSIGADDRRRVLERLVASPIYVVRQLAMSFKAVATLLYATSDAVRAAMLTPVARAAQAGGMADAYEAHEAHEAHEVLDLRASSGNGGLVSAARLTSRGKTATPDAAHVADEPALEDGESDHAAA